MYKQTINKCPVCGASLVFDGFGDKICKACGTYFETVSPLPISTNLPNLEIPPVKEDPTPNLAYGWVCPKCGAVMSPYQNFCIYCSNSNFEITC